MLVVVTGGPSASAATGPGPIAERTAQNVTADALPTVQINGVVWSTAIVGNTVYAGGSFTKARPAGAAPGTNETARTDLLAFNLQTGVLIPSFAPVLNGQVQVVRASPDGARLYIGGGFTSVNGKTHNRIAEFDTVTGTLVSSFTASLDSSVKALAVINSTVYAGGAFVSANGSGRSRLAAFAADSGALLAWKPVADYVVNALLITPDGSKVVVAGAETVLNGITVKGIGAVNTTSGASVTWKTNLLAYSYGQNAAFMSLSTDGTAIYGTAYNFNGTGNLEGAFSASPVDGTVNWIEDCHGDTYSNFATSGIVYTVSHAHYCLNIGGWPEFTPRVEHHSMAFTARATGTALHDTEGYPSHTGVPSPSIINWFPDFTTGTFTGQNQAAWTVNGTSQYLVEGGEFPSVNGVSQQGLVRFAVPTLSPHAQGGRLSGAKFKPTLSVQSNTSVRVSFGSNWDRDDKTLSYRVVRDGDVADPVWTTTTDSEWWNLPTLTFTDTGLSPGSTHTYRIYENDADGNSVSGDSVSVTLPGGTGNPTASFSSTASGLTASFDGSASVSPNGPIVSYAWNFGDGSTGTGATTSHAYSPGTYTVTLTVTDSANRSATTSKSITLPAAQTTTAQDLFTRTLATGWGSADSGGAWTLNGSPSKFAVSAGSGSETLDQPGAGPSAYLGSTSIADVDVTLDVRATKPATGDGIQLGATVRRTGAGDYRVKLKLVSAGAAQLTLSKVLSGTETKLASATLTGFTPAVSDFVTIEFQATGSNPTTLRARAWKAGTVVPTTWAVTASDATAALQGAGSVGVVAYLWTNATNAPVQALFDNFKAGAP